MITPTADQITILSSTRKRAFWAFIVTTGDGLTTYYWSTQARSYAGQAFAAKIIPESFAGITMNAGQSELGIQGPTDLKFRTPNKNNTLSPAAFVDGTVIVRYVLAGAGLETTFRSWKFKIRVCQNLHQHLEFTCVDILQDLLEGQYPLLPLVKDIFLSKNTDQDTSVCVPLPFGTAYIPLRPVYTGGEMFYMLGPASGSFTVSEVRSPRSWGAKNIWPSSGYTLTQATKTDALSRNWKVLSPKIAYSRVGLSVPDVTGFWRNGERFLDIPAKYSWSVTASLTSPADVLAFVLTDSAYGMGLPTGDWDATAQPLAAAVFSGWGLTWNGALWQLEDKEKIITRLLGMCHSVLDSGEKIALRVLSGVPQATITDAVVMRGSDKKSTFTMTAASTRKNPDGGYVSWQEAGESQDEFQRTLVPVVSGATPVRPSTETFACPWVGNSQLAQKLAVLNFQRRFLGAGDCGFVGKRGMSGFYGVMLQTNDVIAINAPSYGGAYEALIKSMIIRRDGSPEFRCMILREAV